MPVKHRLTATACAVWIVMAVLLVRRQAGPDPAALASLPAIARADANAEPGEEWFGVYRGERKIGYTVRQTTPIPGGQRITDRSTMSFAMLGTSQQHTNQLDPELFPHAYNIVKDAQSGRIDGILKRRKTDPLIVHTQTSTEYWQKRGCLAHTDGRGRDLKLPDNVRLYVIASAQHNSPFGSEPVKDDSQFLVNPLPAGDVLRALMVAMDLWATKGIPPPPSGYSSVKDRTLVPPAHNGFPNTPGANFVGLHNRQQFLDYGNKTLRGKIDTHPPKPRSADCKSGRAASQRSCPGSAPGCVP